MRDRHQHARVRFLPPALELALPLLLIGCSGACGKQEQAPASSAKPASGPDDAVLACSVAPAAMVGDVLGLPGLQQTNEKIDGKSTLCQYESKDGAAKHFVSVRFERGYSEAKFEGSKSAFVNPVDIAGLGEKAFVSDMPMQTAGAPNGIHAVAVLKHHTHVTVSAPVDTAKVQFLARELLDQI